MAIDDEQLRRRLVAARVLRDVSQAQLTALCADYGLGKTEAARVERGDLVWRLKHSRAFSEVLNLPARWFEEESVDVLLGVDIAVQRSVDAAGAIAAAADVTGAPPADSSTPRTATRPARSA